MAKEDSKKTLFVEREKYAKDGKEFFSYFVKGLIRGKEVKARLSPQDMGGYDLLDIVFLTDEKAELVITPSEITGEDGRLIKFNSYECKNVDEDGVVYSCKLKPQRASDKSILEMLAQ